MTGTAGCPPQALARREQDEYNLVPGGQMLASSGPIQCRVQGQRRRGLGVGVGVGYRVNTGPDVCTMNEAHQLARLSARCHRKLGS